MGSLPLVIRLLPWLVFAQGILLAGAVATKWRVVGNRYLAPFLALLSLQGATAVAWQEPFNQTAILAATSLLSLPFFYGPLVYRYVWHSLHRDLKDPYSLVLHFLPGIVTFSVYAIVFLVVGRAEFVRIAITVYEGSGPLFVTVMEWTKMAHGILYVVIIARLLRRNREGLSQWAQAEQRRRWLTTMAMSFGLAWVVVFVSGILLFGPGTSQAVTIVVITVQLAVFLLFIYSVSFFAIRHPSVLDPRWRREAIARQLNLPAGFVEETIRRLEKAEKERFYTDDQITLAGLAARLGLHPNALSYILNEVRGVGFRRYLNNLRLDAFISDALRPGQSRTQLELALAAGFASKTTFLRAFKARYGTTPTHYLGPQGAGSHSRSTRTHTGAPGT